ERVKGLDCNYAPPDQHALAILLDAAVVGVREPVVNPTLLSRLKSVFAHYQKSRSDLKSQEQDSNESQSWAPNALSMTDVINFCLLTLFQAPCNPSSVLAQNFKRVDRYKCLKFDISGIVEHFPSGNVKLLKNVPWFDLPQLLGPGAAEVLLDLLLHQSLFTPNDEGVLVQISGEPLPSQIGLELTSDQKRRKLSPNDIVFVRQRMFYAKATLTPRGTVSFGLKHIHVLNRYPDASDPKHTIHILKYIFPRAFGLHNVFTSAVDRAATTARFMDYTMRETEIAEQTKKMNSRRSHGQKTNMDKVPRRLRSVLPLISKLQKLHAKCAYKEILMKRCPVELPPDSYDPKTFEMTTLATSPEAVSSFARSILKRILPHELFGQGQDGMLNLDSLMLQVDVFIKLRRFENLSLHTVAQGLKIKAIDWLGPPGSPNIVSPSDLQIRKDILHELLYYVFDSLLVPLIRSNFYVTESAFNRNRLFYFRHDVWRRLAEAHISRLKAETFEEVPKSDVNRVVAEEAIGASLLRILPKKQGARPLMNLRRRPMIRVSDSNGQRVTRLGVAINFALKPLFEVLNYEKNISLGAFGKAAIGNATDIYPRLKTFREATLANYDGEQPRYYFVKLDVHSCFDTIPQDRLVELVSRIIPQEEVYHIAKYEMYTAPPRDPMGPSRQSKTMAPRRRFCQSVASSNGWGGLYSDSRVRRPLNSLSLINSRSSILRRSRLKRKKRRNTICVPSPARQGTQYKAEMLLKLLRRHVKTNLVRIGKKYYRQRNGIPQGSVVSSLLCNLFYADHEKQHLSFLLKDGRSKRDDALLLRMVDDYLLITTDKKLAVRFLHEMLTPNEKYGITVNPDKTLVNFKVQIDGNQIPQNTGHEFAFPFCGTTIDTNTLALSKGMAIPAKGVTGASDSLTVEMNQTPCRAFFRKMLFLFKLTATTKSPMFLDASYNGKGNVVEFLQKAITETAEKMLLYDRWLDKTRRATQHGKRLSRKQKMSFQLASSSTPGVSPHILHRTVRAIIDCAVHTTVGYNASPHEGVKLNFTHEGPSQSSSLCDRRQRSSMTPTLVRSIAARAFLGVFLQRRHVRNARKLGPTMKWLLEETRMKSHR
ncbi:hypothetical protein KEM56_001993, partial [Ascosphaera pollenicola]